MMKLTNIGLVALSLSSSMFADVVVATNGQWYDWSASAVFNAGARQGFWDNGSDDKLAAAPTVKRTCNVGAWLASSGNPSNCINQVTGNGTGNPKGYTGPTETPLPFLASAANKNVGEAFSFTQTNITRTTLRASVAGLNSTNIFGYYTGSGSSTTDISLFNGAGPNPTVTSFDVTGAFGVFIETSSQKSTAPAPAGTARIRYYSDGSVRYLDSSNVTLSYIAARAATRQVPSAFALFSSNPNNIGGQSSTPGQNLLNYWIGAEDTPIGGTGDLDYNDMIVNLAVVPEPGFYGLLALGLGTFFFFVNRRRSVTVSETNG